MSVTINLNDSRCGEAANAGNTEVTEGKDFHRFFSGKIM